jgi:hypothetical protein
MAATCEILRGMNRMFLGSLLALPLICNVALAQESAGDVAAARELGQQGMKLADTGNCADAVDKLGRSEKMYHAPSVLAKLGECQIQLGKIVEGTENLNRVVRENLGPNAPAAFVTAQEHAKEVLAEAKPRISRLKIAIAAPSSAEFVVTMDGLVVPAANLNVDRPADPGMHTIEAFGPTYKKTSAKVTLEPGKSDSVALALELDPVAVDAAAKAEREKVAKEKGRSESSADIPKTEGAQRSSAPAVISFIAAGALGAGAVGTGLLALSSASDLKALTYASAALGGDRSGVDSARSKTKTFAVVTDVLAGAAILSAGVGVYFLLRSKSTTTVSLGVVPSGLSLVGSFK